MKSEVESWGFFLGGNWKRIQFYKRKEVSYVMDLMNVFWDLDDINQLEFISSLEMPDQLNASIINTITSSSKAPTQTVRRGFCSRIN